MKLKDFKEGDLICRLSEPKKYVANPNYIGACFMFSEIINNMVSLMMLFYPPNQEENGEVYELEVSEYDDDLWDLYKSPKLRRPNIINGLNKKLSDANNSGDKQSIALYQYILNKFIDGNI